MAVPWPWKQVLAALLAGLVVHGAVQALLPGFADPDAWFHGRFAALLASGDAPWNGLSFPYVAKSAYADFPSDWALGWHWLLAPFVAAAGPVTGMKMATAFFGAVLTAIVHGLLVRGGVARAWIWTAALVLGNPLWLNRVAMGRPTPLVVALLLLLVTFAAEARPRAAAVCAFCVLALYHLPQPPLLAAAIGLATAAASGRPGVVRTGAWIVAAMVLAVLCHPGFWSVRGGVFSADRATFAVWGLLSDSFERSREGVLHLALPGGGGIGVPVPEELRGPPAAYLLTKAWLPIVLTAVAAALGWHNRRERPAAAAAALAAVVFLGATTRSWRLMEYWVPFAFLAAPCLLAATRRPWIAGAAAAAGALSLATGAPEVVRHHSATPREDPAELAPAVAAVAERASPGDVVWQGRWDDFAPLFHHGPDLVWLTGMDPWFFAAHDLGAVLLHARTANADYEDDDALRTALTDRDSGLGCRFVILWRRVGPGPQRTRFYDRLERRLRDAPWAELLHADEATAAFLLR